MSSWYVASVDQGTTSSRVIIYDERMVQVASHNKSHKQITPQPGWLQHDAMEILQNVKECLSEAVRKLSQVDINGPGKIKGMGITNQRESVVIWNKKTGLPVHDAIIWCDLRTQSIVDAFCAKHGKEGFRDVTGLPASPYFTAFKVKWIMTEAHKTHPHLKDVAEKLKSGEYIIGTVDSWLVYQLTGGVSHVTSVCNASRTYLMNIQTREWDPAMCELLGVPMNALPRIIANNEFAGNYVLNNTTTIPITGVIGDQHAACVGQLCFSEGDTKNTYGTGCFLLMNTGSKPKRSEHGLLTTICYQMKGEQAAYALEGAVVQAGMLITWLKDNLGLISKPSEVEELAKKVTDSGGITIVPAFAGLFAPHWKSDARGIMCGLTMYTKKEHICRAALVSIAMQTVDVLKAMEKDSGITMRTLKADGGMTVSQVLMQLQSDLARVDVVVPSDKETTALGAGICAAIGSGLMKSLSAASEVVRNRDHNSTFYKPTMPDEIRDEKLVRWHKALLRSHNWVESKM
eukprot:TRINITY_DN20303_c0_g2_i1.p1 TRINITY_DN20303_c0_g2~~TRINITY_DN20303_c0_g2_i1.p1  ORF type:complete len:535 (+),score=124.72 TRINITY_DN20303_c0_g2_i1:60-1607(+)